MPLVPDYWTADMVRALPADGNRYEVVHGELAVTPAPRWMHQVVVMALHNALAPYCTRHALGRMFIVAADLSWGPDILVQPDLFLIAPEDANAGDWARVRRLSLVVEVLSPATARFDRFQKRSLYQAQGIETIWLVDTETRSVEVWDPRATAPVIERRTLRWHPAGVDEALEIPIEDLFR
ncbi:MAG: Uma2 family endonuclease [Gemmatimonadetes bacterium]|nr:Uma2 family endonuclease [Gemmatimonadota bacterium]